MLQLGTVYQLIITLSILISQVLGMNNVLGTEEGWPWLLALTAVPAILQLATLPFCPESPKYLLLDKDDEMAANSGNLIEEFPRNVHSVLIFIYLRSTELASRNY